MNNLSSQDYCLKNIINKNLKRYFVKMAHKNCKEITKLFIYKSPHYLKNIFKIILQKLTSIFKFKENNLLITIYLNDLSFQNLID